MQAHVSIENVAKAFGPFKVLKGVSLDIRRGEFIVLLGPSGCGKSTLLRLIAGLETLSAGTLSINARVVNDVHPRDRNIAMVFQNYALYPHMSVRKNLGYPLKLAGLSQARIDDTVADVARMLELQALLERKPAQLSGGQRQRVAMGRALVRKPEVFLMDEPLSNLDARLRQQMRVEIRDLQQRLGVTTIYVTHDQIEAMTMADRIVVMRDGEIQQIGTPQEIYHAPENRFVASFVGSPPMNFIDEPRLVTQLARPPFKEAGATIGLRPEMIAEGPGQPGDLQLRGVCHAAEALGSETLCHVDLHGQPPDGVRVIVKLASDRKELLGKDVRLSVKAGTELYFDRTSGKRLSGAVPQQQSNENRRKE